MAWKLHLLIKSQQSVSTPSVALGISSFIDHQPCSGARELTEGLTCIETTRMPALCIFHPVSINGHLDVPQQKLNNMLDIHS